MPTLQAFFNAAKSIVSLGASTNASCRQEIRDIVGKLSDELDRALSLADSYLVGARFSKDDAELSNYLGSVDGKLMNSFYEHHICAGLYHLADKFGQVFDRTRFSVSIASYDEIPELIRHLKDGERAVLDDLQTMAQQLRDYAAQVARATPQTVEAIKLDLFNAVDYHRHELGKHRKKIKSLRRRLVDGL
jgi:hypothetical protein